MHYYYAVLKKIIIVCTFSFSVCASHGQPAHQSVQQAQVHALVSMGDIPITRRAKTARATQSLFDSYISIQPIHEIIIGYLDSWEEQIIPLPDCPAIIHKAVFSHDGKYVALGSQLNESKDGSVKIYNAQSGELCVCVKLDDPHIENLVLAFAPDSKLIIACNRTIWSFDTGAKQRIKIASHKKKNIVAIAISSDNTYIAYGLSDGTIKMCGLHTGTAMYESVNALLSTSLLQEKCLNNFKFVCDVGSGFLPKNIRYSPDNTQIVITSYSWGTHFFDIQTMQRVGHCAGDAGVLAFAPMGRYIACGSGDNWIRLFDTRDTHATDRTVLSERPDNRFHAAKNISREPLFQIKLTSGFGIDYVCYSKYGNYLVCAASGQIVIFEQQNTTLISRFVFNWDAKHEQICNADFVHENSETDSIHALDFSGDCLKIIRRKNLHIVYNMALLFRDKFRRDSSP